jgi:hypothetical protein
MFRRVAVLGAAVAVIMAAMIANLWILKIISWQAFTDNLTRTVGVIAVSTIAALLIMALMRAGASPGRE